MATSEDTLNEQVLKQVECPDKHPPIMMCVKGHICEKCQKNLSACSSCNQLLDEPEIKHRALEDLTPSLKYPCENHDVGCQVVLVGNDIRSHERSCPLRLYSCPLDGCEWNSRLHMLSEHICKEHNDNNNNDLLLAASEVTLHENVLSQLECPVCMHFMHPPIIMCRNGHNICEKCRKNLSACPSCNQILDEPDIRNRALEDLAPILKYPCENRDAGCQVVLASNDIGSHERSCPLRQYSCPVVGCQVTSRLHLLSEHVHKDHEKLIAYTSRYFTFGTKYNAYNFMVKHSEIFWRYMKSDPTKSKVSWATQYVGPEEKAKYFQYRVVFKSVRLNKTITIVTPTHSLDEDFNSIIDSGKGIDFPVSLAAPFIGEDNCVDFKQYIDKIETL